LNYAGIAQRGRVRERLEEQLGDIPGAKVEIEHEQFSSITGARKKEKNVIKKTSLNTISKGNKV